MYHKFEIFFFNRFSYGIGPFVIEFYERYGWMNNPVACSSYPGYNPIPLLNRFFNKEATNKPTSSSNKKFFGFRQITPSGLPVDKNFLFDE
jgi:hypothetical protein